MQGNHANTHHQPDTQHWTGAEKALLRKLAPLSTRKDQLRAMFPGRSLAAIKLKLFAARRELGIPKRGVEANLIVSDATPTMLDPNDEGLFAPTWADAQRPRFALANTRYLAALGIAA